MKYGLKFSKRGRITYISHLDLQRLFIRVLRIAEIKPLYSNGFNPHPKLSIAVPLSLGFSSKGEYLEIETEEAIDPKQISEKLNKILPEGIKILAAGEKKQDFTKSMSSYAAFGSYEIMLPGFEGIKEAIDGFLAEEKIPVMKESKKNHSVKTVDIKPAIISVYPSMVYYDTIIVNSILSVESGSALNPLTMISALYDHAGRPFDRNAVRIERTDIHMKNENAKPGLSLGEIIE